MAAAAARAPAVVMSRNGVAIGDGQPITTDEPRFEFDLEVTTDRPLTRAEVWYGPAGGGPAERLEGVTAAAAAAGRLRPAVRLRRGVNEIRVVAANAGATTDTRFHVSFTPPPVRVVIDTLREPGGPPHKFDPDAPGAWPADGGVVEVTGRVEWDDPGDPIGLDPHLAVVFTANGVVHPPVRVNPVAGKKERAFTGRVFLNAFDAGNPGLTRVRAQLRSGSRPGAVAQAGREDAGFTAASKNPLDKQRLHLLIIGVEVPERDRAALVRRVVRAVGGEVPADNPEFDRLGGTFYHRGCARAILHRPQVGNVSTGHLNGLLADVEQAILRAPDRGEDWVNDFILVHYEGKDWWEGGKRFLHTSSSLRYDPAATAAIRQTAIRRDELPPVPGMLLYFDNITDPARPGAAGLHEPPLLWFSWKKREDAALLSPLIGQAVRQKRSFGEIADAVLAEAKKLGGLSAEPFNNLTPDIRGRAFGLQEP
jgi:hypothetical protein